MANDVRAGLDRQIAELKAEMSRMAKALVARTLRDHPAATAAALSTIGLPGLAAGSMPGGRRR